MMMNSSFQPQSFASDSSLFSLSFSSRCCCSSPSAQLFIWNVFFGIHMRRSEYLTYQIKIN